MGADAGEAPGDTPMPELRVRLFGGLSVCLGGVPVPSLGSRAESLLAYVLLHRDAPQQRRHLAYLLWPDSTQAQARTNLRHVLHRLGRGLPDLDRFVEVGPQTLQWRREAPVWLDVAEFEQAIADGRQADAVESYTGPLLEGMYDDWLLDERERLAQLHRDALERLARQLGTDRRFPEAVRHAERLVRLDPLREEAHRLLIRLCDAAGRRAQAVRAYHVCEATLKRELGVAPAAATRAAYEALLPSVADRSADERGAASPARPPLVGRTGERARLAALWRTATRGNAQFVIVTGEPGVGKTRLVEELRSWCAHHGATTAEARAYPMEGAMAFGAVGAWLRTEPIAGRVRRLDRVHLTELARVLPELLAEVPGLAGPEPLAEAEQRERLFRAIATALLAAGNPLLLVADDLQWWDVQSLQFLHYLLRAEPSAPVLVAGTARREEIDPQHPVGRLGAALAALGRFCEIGLERLDRGSTVALGERLAGRSLTAAEADRLYADSEGNPLFVVEAMRADPGIATGPGGAGGSRTGAIIAARLAQLSEPAAELVGLAATVGREFTTQILADASGAAEATLVHGLDELWRRGLVRAVGPTAYDFSHGRIREAAYRGLSPAQLHHHHLHVARALQRRDQAQLDAVATQVAAHLAKAGSVGEAIPWYERAAGAAQRLHANATAVQSLERALELLSELPADADTAAVELRLLTAMPAPLIAVEGYLSPRLTEVHERALTLADAHDIEPAAPLVRSLALATLTRGDFDDARPFGVQLRALADRDGDDVLWVESAYVLGVAAFWQGRLGQARAEFEAAVARYRPEHRAVHLLRYGQDPEVFCLMRLAYTHWLQGHDGEADAARDTALARAERSAHPYTRQALHGWAGLLALDRRDEAGVRHHVHVLGATDPTHGPPQIQVFVDAFTGLLEVLDGRVEAGLRRARRAVDDARAGTPAAPGANACIMRILLEAYAIAGDARRGLAATDEALDMGEGTQLWEPEIRRLRAGFLAALATSTDEVRTELERAVAVAQQQGARAMERRARVGLDALAAAGTP